MLKFENLSSKVCRYKITSYICSVIKNKEIMKALLNKLTNVDTETLKEMAVKLNNDFSNGADLVFDAVINTLENRVDEVEFLELMENLD